MKGISGHHMHRVYRLMMKGDHGQTKYLQDITGMVHPTEVHFTMTLHEKGVQICSTLKQGKVYTHSFKWYTGSSWIMQYYTDLAKTCSPDMWRSESKAKYTHAHQKVHIWI